MKIIPGILLAIAAIAGVYFFYLKPKQQKVAADNAAALAASQADLLKLPVYKVTDKIGAVSKVTSKISL